MGGKMVKIVEIGGGEQNTPYISFPLGERQKWPLLITIYKALFTSDQYQV